MSESIISVFPMHDDAAKPVRQELPATGGDAARHEPGAEAPGGPGPQIEELLLSGLDRYFAGRHEDAIHIWTRVLFIDRGHRRARAYIERARLALAERQREHEILLQDGVEALGRGDTGAARELLARSVRDAGPDDRALAALAHLDRLQHAAVSYAPAYTAPAAPRAARRSMAAGAWISLLLIAALSAGAAAVAIGAFGAPSWWTGARPVTAPVGAIATPLPVIAAGEAALVRARALQAQGRLREAAQALEAVPANDRLRADADRLLIDLQDALIASAAR
jgi:hypothetical protein